MQVIRPGMQGKDVTGWRLFLSGNGNLLRETDGRYDAESAAAGAKHAKVAAKAPAVRSRDLQHAHHYVG